MSKVKKEVTAVYLDPDLKEEFQRIIRENGLSMSSAVELIIKNVVDGKIKIRVEIEN